MLINSGDQLFENVLEIGIEDISDVQCGYQTICTYYSLSTQPQFSNKNDYISSRPKQLTIPVENNDRF